MRAFLKIEIFIWFATPPDVSIRLAVFVGTANHDDLLGLSGGMQVAVTTRAAVIIWPHPIRHPAFSCPSREPFV